MIEVFNGLNDDEKEIVSTMAILPGEFFSIPQLSLFFYIEENEYATFFDTIHDLSISGFLESEKGLYAIKPEIAIEILEKIKPGIEECPRIVNYLVDKMEVPTKDYEGIFLPVYKQLSTLLERIDKKSLHLAQLSYLLSSNLIRHNKFQEALRYNQLAVEISEEIDDRHPLVALFYRDKAYIYKKMGDHEKAIYYSLKDIEILERHQGKYDDLLPDSYFALSKTYEMVRNYNKAVEYNLKAIQYAQDAQRKSNKLSYLYQNLAFYYAKLNNLHHASIFINKAVEFYTSENKKDKFEYMQLMRDQKKYNSLHEIELIIRKFKYPIIIFIGFCFGILLWILYNLL
jgi:tetratricopeptide (TPR) repeat protein